MRRSMPDPKMSEWPRGGRATASAAAILGYRPLAAARSSAWTCSAALASWPAGAACIAPDMAAKPLITAMTSSLAPVLSLEPASRPRK
jgi:hypothetical protein